MDYICGSEPSVQRGGTQGVPLLWLDFFGAMGKHGKNGTIMGQKNGEKPTELNDTPVFAIR